MLIAFSGLPGVGKTTVAREAAARLGAVYLRIDSIEQALRDAGTVGEGEDMGPAGYVVAYRLAADNLTLGRTVVADSVNPIALTRDAYLAVAERAGVPLVEVELVCSDRRLHRERLEARKTDVPGAAQVSWEAVLARRVDPWARPRLLIDTAVLSAEACVGRVVDEATAASGGRLATEADEATILIATEDPRQPEVRSMIAASDSYMQALYPAESNHLVDAETLAGADTVFLVARRAGRACGMVAFRVLEPGHAEMKRMFVPETARGLGLGRRLLLALEDAARGRGVVRLSLETGVLQPEAIGLYRSAGYVECGPFGDYRPDPLSLFMSKGLGA